MPIALDCRSCGRELKLKDELAGKKVKCPECEKVLTVPGPDDEEVDELEEVDDSPVRKKKRKPKPRQRSVGFKVFLGVAMIIGAVVWFVLGLQANRIFFYPPVLLVLGIIAIAKAGQED